MEFTAKATAVAGIIKPGTPRQSEERFPAPAAPFDVNNINLNCPCRLKALQTA
ncbi:TPA: hypothetical protein WI656_000181 [Neisseria meningitidis]|uniref:hypothetical protein n=1 Tax=Neisseria meningitidis TaxID=487 RepID=UPI0002DDFBDF|nr:hypothetical protein [Neisseria meningitidis]MBJ7868797.1 hypothetical protein [Neisseria meningitidis]MBW3929447.1 hypothetical protein [Neisseria meningitidis]MBW4000339.1 hypothetical protein [Neisseria meningitidis]MCG3356933.1 hypothetical protein [Neisseria meningitidis]MCL4966624.1 hypothetical protein [Neisseria meningitidis]